MAEGVNRKKCDIIFNKNFYFDNEQAFTEDDVLIYQIIFFNVPLCIKKEILYRYFLRYGKINKLFTISTQGRGQHGFVHFKESRGAYNALSEQSHAIYNKYFLVKASDSWHQPRPKTNTNNQCKETVLQIRNDQLNNGNFNLLSLNDYCLNDIMGLVDLRTQLHLASTCERLQAVFMSRAKIHFKAFILHNVNLTLLEIKYLFTLIGETIQKLYIQHEIYEDRIYEFITEYCTNLEELTIAKGKNKISTFYKIAAKLHNLKRIHLYRSPHLTEEAVKALRKLPNLQALTIQINYNLRGKYIYTLKNVTELNLCGAECITTDVFFKILHSLTNLKLLNMQRLYSVSPDVFKELPKCCRQLEILHISHYIYRNFEHIAFLPNLRILDVLGNYPTQFPSQLFQYLSEQPMQHIEYLKVAGELRLTHQIIEYISKLTKLKYLYIPQCNILDDNMLMELSNLYNLEHLNVRCSRRITNLGLLYLLRNCSKLNKLHIQKCERITNDILIDIITILEKRYVYKTEPMEIFMSTIRNNNKMLNLVAQKSKLIKLTFDPIKRTSYFYDLYDDLHYDSYDEADGADDNHDADSNHSENEADIH